MYRNCAWVNSLQGLGQCDFCDAFSKQLSFSHRLRALIGLVLWSTCGSNLTSIETFLVGIMCLLLGKHRSNLRILDFLFSPSILMVAVCSAHIYFWDGSIFWFGTLVDASSPVPADIHMHFRKYLGFKRYSILMCGIRLLCSLCFPEAESTLHIH